MHLYFWQSQGLYVSWKCLKNHYTCTLALAQMTTLLQKLDPKLEVTLSTQYFSSLLQKKKSCKSPLLYLIASSSCYSQRYFQKHRQKWNNCGTYRWLWHLVNNLVRIPRITKNHTSKPSNTKWSRRFVHWRFLHGFMSHNPARWEDNQELVSAPLSSLNLSLQEQILHFRKWTHKNKVSLKLLRQIFRTKFVCGTSVHLDTRKSYQRPKWD